MRKYIAFIIVFISISMSVSAQDCSDYHQYHCVYADYTFFYSRQSKSTLMMRGQTASLNMVVYGGEDYYVGVCAHRKFGDLQFKILEDNDEGTVIYDNASDDFATSIIFSNEHTRNLIVEVSVPKGSGNDKDRRCVGVLVQFRKDDEGIN